MPPFFPSSWSTLLSICKGYQHTFQVPLEKATTACCRQAWIDAGLGSPSLLCNSTARAPFPHLLAHASMSLPMPKDPSPHAHKVLPRVGRLMVRDTFSL